MGVERAADGTIEAVTPARGAPRRESVMHFQTDRRLDNAGLEALEAALRRSLSGLRLAVRDFLPMVERVERMIEAAEAAGARYPADEMHESIEFLSWLTDDNFIYLGYREYEVTEVDGRPAAGIVPGVGPGRALGREPVEVRDARAGGRARRVDAGADLRRAARHRVEDERRDDHPPQGADGLHRREAGRCRAARSSASCG